MRYLGRGTITRDAATLRAMLASIPAPVDAVDVADLIDTAYGLQKSVANKIQINAGTGVTFSAGALVLNWSGTPGSIAPDDAAAGGSSLYAARTDHVHGITCAAPGSISPDDAAAEGSAGFFARSDHVHGITCAAPGSITPDAAAAEGSAGSFARSDHVHGITCAAPGSIAPVATAAEGASSSFARADHVHGATAGIPGSLTPDQAAAEGASSSFARLDHAHGIACAAPGANSVNIAASAEGSASSFARSDHTHNLDVSIAPTWSGTHTFNQSVYLANATPLWLTSTGSGTYNLTILYHDTTNGLYFDVARATDSAGGAALPIQFAHRGGPTAFVITEYDARVAGGIYVGSLAVDPPAGEVVATGKGTFSKAMLGADPVHGTTYASFWNADLTRDAGNYCILHSNAGDTYINAATGKAVTFQVNNSNVTIVDAAGIRSSGGLVVGDLATSPTAGTAIIKTNTALTASATTGLTLKHNSSGTPAAGFGNIIAFLLETTTTEDQNAGAIKGEWVTATHASRAGAISLWAYDASAAREGVRVSTDGSQPLLGFYGATPVARQAQSKATQISDFYTANAGYDSNEQDMLNAIVDDLINVFTWLDDLTTKLENVGIIS